MTSPTDPADLSKAGTRFPFINLEKALERAQTLFEADPKGREMPITGAFAAWGYSEKSSGGFQTIAALKMYGILKEGGSDSGRKLGMTDEALLYFRDERDDEKLRLRQFFAHHPKLIQSLWARWGASPPADTVARSQLKTEASLNDQSARSLLAIYKENVTYAEFKGDDKLAAGAVVTRNVALLDSPPENTPNTSPSSSLTLRGHEPKVAVDRKGLLMEGERELTAGLLSKDTNFRLIVSGNVGVREIERLIAKLELDKEILAEAAADDE